MSATSIRQNLRAHVTRSQDPTYRRPTDIILLVISVFVLVISSLLLLASRGAFDNLDASLFRTINRLPGSQVLWLWAVMQAGSGWAIPVVTLLGLLSGRLRLAGKLAIAGSLAWYLNKLFKIMIDRGRPFDILDQVVVRGTPATGLGFPSGHVTIAFAMAMVSAPHFPRRWRWIPWLIASLVAFARIYVGAHFPIDVVGGIALGGLIGAVVNLVLGVPQPTVSLDRIREVFGEYGLELTSLEPVSSDARGSVPYFATDTDGNEYFVKLLGDEQRNADFLFKVWRTVVLKDVVNAAPFLSPKQQVEHEAYLTLLAQECNVLSPEIQFVTAIGDGYALLVQRRLGGETLDHIEPKTLEDSGLLAAIWELVKKLHGAHIAHGDLRLANIMLTESGDPALIDFGFADGGASDAVLAQDRAQLLATLAAEIGAQRAVSSALGVLGDEAVAATVRALHPLALSSVTREALKDNPDLLDELRDEIEAQVSVELPEDESVLRLRPQTLLWVLGLGAGVYFLLPQLAELRKVIDLWRQIPIPQLLLGLALSALAYVMAALSLRGALSNPVGFLRNIVAHLAASFANRLGPPGLGGALVIEQFLENSGIRRGMAVTAIAVKTLAGTMVHMIGMVLTLLLLGQSLSKLTGELQGWHFAIAAALIVGALIFAAVKPDKIRDIWRSTRRSFRSLRETLSDPRKALELLGGALGTTGAYILTLAVSLWAVGADASLITIAAVYLAGSVIGSASPTPGGLGVLESAFVAGLTTFGVGANEAVAGVLLYRLLTFWIPIIPGLISFRYLQREGAL